MCKLRNLYYILANNEVFLVKTGVTVEPSHFYSHSAVQKRNNILFPGAGPSIKLH